MHTADCSFTGGNSNLNSCKWISHQNKNLKSIPNFKKHCILTHSHQRPSRVYTESVCVCELAKLPICKQKHMLNYHHSISKSISRLRVCVVFFVLIFPSKVLSHIQKPVFWISSSECIVWFTMHHRVYMLQY